MPIYKAYMLTSEKVSSKFERQVVSLDNLMMVICNFTNGPAAEPDPPHSHTHEQITYVEEGELFLFIADEKFYLKKGDIYTVPSEVPHCIQTISRNVILLDCFTPVRKEFLK